MQSMIAPLFSFSLSLRGPKTHWLLHFAQYQVLYLLEKTGANNLLEYSIMVL